MDWARLIERSGIGLAVVAVIYMYTTFAKASDIQRLEAQQARGEVREFCYKWITAPEDSKSFVARLVREAVDELCYIDPDDRRCAMTVEEVCTDE